MSQYEAMSLADIAEMFERFAVSADEQGKTRGTKAQKAFEIGRATAWRDAANLLRKTTLTDPGTP